MNAAPGKRADLRSASGAGPRSALALVALAGLVAWLYAQTARHGFLSFDDGAYLTENPHVNGGLSLANARWAFAEFHSANWHPLTWLSHQLDWSVFGSFAGGHHLVNAGLHALAACLCFLFFVRATERFWPSVLVAVLFAVHPERVESVAWASERKDVLSGVFFFAVLLAYERHARRPSRRGLAWVALWFALGLLAKPMLVTVPVVLWGLDHWPLGRSGRSPSLAPTRPGEIPGAAKTHAQLREKLPLLALSAVSCLVTLLAQRSGGAVRSMEQLDLPTRLSTAVLGFWHYVADALWPAGLAFYYPHPAFASPESYRPFAWPFWAGLGGLLALFFGAWSLRRRAPAVPTGLAWMAVMLLPVIGLVQVGAQFAADRYAYLPQLGLLFALVFGAEQLLASPALRRAALALGAAAALALLPLTYRQVATWRDNVSLTTRALAVTKNNYVAHQHLGLEYQRRREFALAREQYLAALAIAPSMHDTHSNLGAVYMQLGEREQALAHYRRALALVPDFLDAQLNIGLLLEQDEDLAGAREQYLHATRAHPEAPEAWTKLGDAEFGLGRAREAVAAYRQALDLRADALEARAGLGEALLALGEERAAAGELARPELRDHVRALHAEVRLLSGARDAALRDPERAAQRLQACPEGARAGWAHLRALAMVLARQGRFDDAVRALNEAAASAPRAFGDVLAEERRRYQARRASGDPP